MIWDLLNKSRCFVILGKLKKRRELVVEGTEIWGNPIIPFPRNFSHSFFLIEVSRRKIRCTKQYCTFRNKRNVLDIACHLSYGQHIKLHSVTTSSEDVLHCTCADGTERESTQFLLNLPWVYVRFSS